MNITKEIDLDIRQIDSLKAFHLYLKKLFGFFDGYGENVHALIDCLSSIRDEGDSIIDFRIDDDATLLVRINGFTPDKMRGFLEMFIFAVNVTNNREVHGSNRTPAIYLLFLSEQERIF